MGYDTTQRLIRLGFGVGGNLAPNAMAKLALRLFTRPGRMETPPHELELASQGTPLRFRKGLAATAFGRSEAPTVVLMHGWAGRGLQLGAFIAPLTAAGYRVVALDGPAHGASPGHETDPLHLALALLEVGEELGPLKAVVGHSVGGAAAVLALHRGLRAERLVMIASPSDLGRVLRHFSQEIGLPPRGERKLFALVASRVGAPIEEGNLVRLAPAMKTPLLVIHDPQDKEVPFSDAEALVAAWPGAQLWAARGLGHRRVLRAPETMRRVVAFLGPPVGTESPVAQTV
jgi:pimeloyl-ACP methyl ester carboxylesterase